jgi:hypothetical protein
MSKCRVSANLYKARRGHQVLLALLVAKQSGRGPIGSRPGRSSRLAAPWGNIRFAADRITATPAAQASA